ncbi:MAG: tetratricopeptide repeat protein, partial [Chitinophagales bacterium]
MTKQEELQLAKQYFEEGEKLTEKVKYKESIEVLEKTSAIYERWEKWEKWVEANNLKGRNLCNLGEYNTGIEFLEEVLKTGKIYLEENNIQIAQSWNNLAICHWYKGDYNPTIAYLQTAYKIRKTCGDDIKVAESLSNLGVCYEDKGEYELAISTHHEALAIFQKYYDSNDLRINNALENMAACYQDIGDYDQAISIYYKASTILNLHLDNTHPRIASNLANLSTCFSQKGDYELALDYSIKSLQIREALWGNNHPKLIDSIINLGRRYYVINNYASALKYFQRANTLYTNCIDKNHFERGRLLT